MSKSIFHNLSSDKQGRSDIASISRHKSIIKDWIENWLIVNLKVTKESLGGNSVLAEHGLDSVLSVELIAALEDKLRCDLEDTLLWNYTTVEALVEYLNSNGLLNRLSNREMPA